MLPLRTYLGRKLSTPSIIQSKCLKEGNRKCYYESESKSTLALASTSIDINVLVLTIKKLQNTLFGVTPTFLSAIISIIAKELSLCNKIKYLNLNIFRTRCCKPLIFQTQIIRSNRFHSLKYLRSATFGSKDIAIRKSEFVTKTQFLWKYFIN